MLDCFVNPYTYHRIKQIFRDDYHLELVRLYFYKGERYGKVARYNLVRDDGTVAFSNVTLFALRKVLTIEGYPLQKEDTK